MIGEGLQEMINNAAKKAAEDMRAAKGEDRIVHLPTSVLLERTGRQAISRFIEQEGVVLASDPGFADAAIESAGSEAADGLQTGPVTAEGSGLIPNDVSPLANGQQGGAGTIK